MKRCFKCGETKPLDEFYRHPQMGDGHLNKCKACAKRDASEHLKRKVASLEGLAAERARGRDKHHRLYKGKRPATRKSAREWQAKNPEKRLAHNLVAGAVKSGALTKPDCCSNCGVVGPVQGHHEDYAKPLVVTWLCVACHMFRHRKPISA